MPYNPCSALPHVALWPAASGHISCAQDEGLPSDIIAGIEDWVTSIQRSPMGRDPTSSATPSPLSREVQDLRLDCRELERELAQVRTGLDRERQRREIAEAETAGLRETLRDHIPSRKERVQMDALR